MRISKFDSWIMRSKCFWALLMIAVIVLSAFLRWRVLNYESIETTGTGRVQLMYRCGLLVRQLEFGSDIQNPVREIVRPGPSFSSCLRTYLFFQQGPEAKPVLTTVLRDLEPDGRWDQKILFSGGIGDRSLAWNEDFFQYFLRGADGAWVQTNPPQGVKTFFSTIGLEDRKGPLIF